MPVYRFEAVDDQGQATSGTMAAENELVLGKKLRSAGLWVTESSIEVSIVAPVGRGKSSGFSFPLMGRRKRRALIDFCTMMSFQTKVGIPLVQALEGIASQYENIQFRQVVAEVQRSVEGGMRLHEALNRHPDIFSNEFVGVIKAGESSSRLPEAFRDLKKYLEWVDSIVQQVRQATLYPAIVLGVIFCFVMFLFTFVVPKFEMLLTRLNLPLPFLTQLVFGVSEFAKSTWWLWLFLTIVATLGVRLGQSHSPAFAYLLDSLKLRLPFFGPLNQMLAISRFSQNFVVLYRAGIPILQSLELCQVLVNNKVVAEAVGRMQVEIQGGMTISDSMRRSEIFPPMLLRMVVMGEKTGNLDTSLADVGDYFNQVIPEKIKRMLTILEPTLMLLLIGVVLLVALAIYLPLITMMGGIH